MRRWSEEWRGNTTSRLVDLVLRVQRGPVRPSELAREYQVHPRTINRYLTEIERHIPVRRVDA
jgi:DeoR/GlpR family transcriptional regulator of sugar metabolism